MPTRSTVPAFASSAVSSVNAAPSASCTGPSRKHSMRIFGPPRSSSTPTHRSVRRAASRTRPSRRRRSSTVPCEALSRTTSSPARIICVSTSRSSVAGPTVATILARRLSIPFGSSSIGALLQHGDRRQRLALDELEKGATTGRDIGDTILDAVLLDGGERIAAAGEREGLAARNGHSDGARAFAELVELEHPHRAVPDGGTGRLQQGTVAVGGVGADVENHLVTAHFAHPANVGVRGGGEFPTDHHIARQRDLRAPRARLVHEPAGDVEHLGLVERLADVGTGRGEEGVGDAATRSA